MQITYVTNDAARTVAAASGATVAECLRMLNVSPLPLAVMRGGEVLELSEPLMADGTLRPVVLPAEEGRRLYERSLRFVMLLACRRLWPEQRVRVEYSAGQGVFVRLPGREMTQHMLALLETEMRGIVQADLPFRKRRWDLADAVRYFEQDGQADKVALLRHRPFPFFNMYEVGVMWDYFYGAMAASTGCVPVFGLTLRAPGFVLRVPDKQDPSRAADYVDQPKHLSVFAQSAKWCEILGVLNAADLAELMEQGELREFIRINEALHDAAIDDLAERIVQEGRRIILIAGPSSSGKTTFAGRLRVHLKVRGCHPVQLGMDDYYLDRNTLPKEADGTVDLESISALDVSRLQSDLRRLLDGETVEVPVFDFKQGRRAAQGIPTRLEPGQMILVEGIHGLDPLIAQGLPQATIHRIFVSALTCINLDDHDRIRTTDVRLLRRIVRDHNFRGTLPEDTLAMWDSVRRGEDRWIYPYQELADDVFNTALHYELPILKHFAYDLLKAIPPDKDCCLAARRLLKTLHYFPAVDPALLDEIPPTSLLREFIGGCTFDKG